MDNKQSDCERILAAAQEQRVVLRAIGGMAIRLHAPKASSLPVLQRSYGDLDFVTTSQDSPRLREFFAGIDFTPNARFNALQGHSRMIFNAPGDAWYIDIFIDTFKMCHTIRFDRQRLLNETQTIPLAELFLTKLQIVQINEKDVKDIAAMLLDHPVGDRDQEMVNAAWLADICRADWGFYTSVMKNIERIPPVVNHFGLPDAECQLILERLGQIKHRMEAAPKTMGWKMRAAVGEKVKWYEEPEDAAREAITKLE